MTSELEKAKTIKQKFEGDWFKLDEVVAVGIGKISAGKIGIIVSVKSNQNGVRQFIPAEVEGVPVKIEKTGEISAL